MIALLASPITKYVTAALAAVLVFGGAYIKGRSDGSSITESKYANAKADWQREVAKKQTEFDVQLSNLRLRYERETAQYRREIASIKNNPSVVTKFVPVETQCNIPKGFVELHNRAATGVPLDPPPADPSTPTDKTLSGVGSVVAQNYYQCNILMDRLIALQEIVKDYQKKQKELTK